MASSGKSLLAKKYVSRARIALYANFAKLNLKSVKRIDFKFDPFDNSTQSVREANHAFSLERVRKTNPECSLRTKVVCDRSEPMIDVQLENGHKLVYKTKFLSTLDIVEHFNKSLEKIRQPIEDIPIK